MAGHTAFTRAVQLEINPGLRGKLTARELSARLGLPIWTVQRMAKSGKIPSEYCAPLNRYFFDYKAVQKALRKAGDRS